MAEIKVLAGDIEKGSWTFVSLFGQALMKKGSPEINLKEETESIELLDEEKYNKLARKAGWAIAGGIATGGVGLVAGALFGGRKKTMTFACELKDGRKFMAVTDRKSWTKIQAATFS